MKCPWGCGWEGTPSQYSEHYNECPAKVCPKCGSTNIFFFRVDEIQCIVCGHTWKKGEVPKVEEAPPVDEERTWLIRNKTLVETEGRVEEPLETPEEVVEETSEETPEEADEPSEE